jgi:hypothetical protein
MSVSGEPVKTLPPIAARLRKKGREALVFELREIHDGRQGTNEDAEV